MPPLKVIFDTSALRVVGEQPEPKVAALGQAIRDGRVEFYASDPVIAETVNIPNETTLGEHVSYLGLLADRKYFLGWEGAVYYELCGQPRALRDGEDERVLTNVLMGVSQGKEKGNVAAIVRHMDMEKDRLHAYYLSLQKRTRAMFGSAPRTPGDLPYDFDYVDEGFWKRRGRDLVTRARLLGNDDPRSMRLGAMSNNPWTRPLIKLLGTVLHGGLARRVVRNPDQYPYTRHYARVFSMLVYRSQALNERVKRNDPYDAQIIYWGMACDALLTHDSAQKARFVDLYGGAKPAYAVEELFQHLGIQ